MKQKIKICRPVPGPIVQIIEDFLGKSGELYMSKKVIWLSLVFCSFATVWPASASGSVDIISKLQVAKPTALDKASLFL
jgi:hypothetical protein